MLTYIKRIESLITYPGQHTVEASQAEKGMKFKEEDLKVGRSPIIDASQFIQAVADSLNERLFTTKPTEHRPALLLKERNLHHTVNQMAVLDPENGIMPIPDIERMK
ncbi:Hypothetical protein FKW44_003952 [Caligus rogercresseyi]|uniref:Uncharacterized protein n=1 Tax=Caligus rogercresseyi TaxID=217165 RepID=A0A7T8KMR6_CALRO|nr:Hypothetical protein FKW44_003952 [Caligus rogercresseyi]